MSTKTTVLLLTLVMLMVVVVCGFVLGPPAQPRQSESTADRDVARATQGDDVLAPPMQLQRRLASEAPGLEGWLLGPEGDVFSFVDIEFRESTEGKEASDRQVTTVRTGAAGDFTIRLGLGQWIVALPNRRVKLSPERINVKEPMATQTAIVVVASQVYVAGVVQDGKDSKGIEGATVDVVGVRATGADNRLVAGRDGAFAGWVWAGGRHIRMIAKHAEYVAADELFATGGRSVVDNLRLEMERGVVVHGVVREQDSGVPVEGVRVLAPNGAEIGRTGKGGSYHTVFAPTQDANGMRFVHPAFLTAVAKPNLSVTSTSELDVVLSKRERIRISVIDESGSMRPDAAVQIGVKPGLFLGESLPCDGMGVAEVYRASPGMVFIEAQVGEALRGMVVVDPGVDHATVVVSPVSRVRLALAIRDDQGRPVPRAVVDAGDDGNRVSGVSDDLGMVALNVRDTSEVRIVVQASGYATKAMRVSQVSVGGLRVVELSRYHQIKGVAVERLGGAPIPDVKVRVLQVRRGAGRGSVPMELRRQGVRFAGLSGEWFLSEEGWQVGDIVKIELSSDGYTKTSVDVQVTARDEAPEIVAMDRARR